MKLNLITIILLSLSIQTSLSQEAVATSRNNPYFKADLDHEFDQGTSISISQVTSEQIENLQILAKVWGFVKYYHPETAKGNIQWDYELFRIMPKILASSSPGERNNYLAGWIKQANRYLNNIQSPPADTTDCYTLPALEWIYDSQLLGSELVTELSKIKNSERESKHYYINWENPGGLAGDFIGEKSYPEIGWEDTGYRLLTLFRYWNVIEYCYPYKAGLNWNEVLKRYLPEFIQTGTQMNYLNSIYALCAEIKDSHGKLEPLEPYMFAAIFLPIEGKPFVKKSYSCELKAGDLILKMDGKDVEDILVERRPFVSASNELRREYFIISGMNRWNKNQLEVAYLRGNDTITVQLTDFNLTKEIPGCTSEIIPKDYQKELTDLKIVYLKISELSAESLTLIEDSMMQSDGMILDCRGYPSHDSFYDKLSDMVFPDTVCYMEISELDVQNPGTFRFYHRFTTGRKNPDAYKGRVIILVNETTQSAAETAVMMFQQVPNSITIGSQSSAANGSAVYFPLPGGINTIFTGTGCYYPNKEMIQRVGVKIDDIVYPTKELLMQGRDDLLEKAIETIKINHR